MIRTHSLMNKWVTLKDRIWLFTPILNLLSFRQYLIVNLRNFTSSLRNRIVNCPASPIKYFLQSSFNH